MVLNAYIPRILAAIAMIVILAAPSLAQAHSGHAHLVGTTAESPYDVGGANTQRPEAAKGQAVQDLTAATSDQDIRRSSGCDNHCCGAAAGMTCCGAALAPESFFAITFSGRGSFAIPRVRDLGGLVPETPPKPPRPFG